VRSSGACGPFPHPPRKMATFSARHRVLTGVTNIHHTAMVGKDVELGRGVVIGPNVVVLAPAVIGDDCWIGPGSVIGAPPEITSARHNEAWAGDLAHSGVEIGARTVLRELSVVHQGSSQPTRIGQDCWVLNHAQVAHDCQIGAAVTLSAGTTLGGHVRIGERATVGMHAVVHQRRVIGPGVMVGMGSVVTMDLPPFAKAYGNPARLHGVNRVGMNRAGIGESVVRIFEIAYGELLEPLDIPAEVADAFDWWTAAHPARSPLGQGVHQGP
jgi:UDP-N-acetylglucosamine acyltransferase